jgi:hypothetical protein
MKWMGSKIYSETPLEPYARLWATKQNSFNYLDQLFFNLRPELFIHLKGASKEQWELAREQIYQAKTMPGRPIVTYGSEESATEVNAYYNKFGNEQGLDWVLSYLRSAMASIVRYPVAWIETGKSGQAAVPESQILNYETRLKKIQSKIQYKISQELLPALGFNHLTIEYNPVTLKTEKDVIINAASLQSMGVKPNALAEYLHRNGVHEVQEDDFINPEDMMGNGNQTASNNLSPSRKPSSNHNQVKNLDETGRSSKGSEKMEQKGMNMRSTNEFNSYPYTIEVI